MSPKILIAAGAQAAAQGLVRSALLTKLLPLAGAVSLLVGLFGRKGSTETRPAAGDQNLARAGTETDTTRSYHGLTTVLGRSRDGAETKRGRSGDGADTETTRSRHGPPRRRRAAPPVMTSVQPSTGGLSHGHYTR